MDAARLKPLVLAVKRKVPDELFHQHPGQEAHIRAARSSTAGRATGDRTSRVSRLFMVA